MSAPVVLAALGLLLIYSGIVSRPADRRPLLLIPLEGRGSAAGHPGLTPGRIIVGSLGLAMGVFILVTGATRSVIVGLSLGVLALGGPISWLDSKARKRHRRFRDAWPDALATLIASVRAGMSLPEACLALSDRGPHELRGGYDAFRSSYRSGGSFVLALISMRDALADPIADRVAASLLLAHEVGGSDLVRTLRATSDFVLEDTRVRKEIEARWSWTVSAARVAASAPWIVLMMMATRPEAAQAFDSPAGASVVLGGGIATVLGYRLMLRAGRLPQERRLA